jgi:hypothetical protein
VGGVGELPDFNQSREPEKALLGLVFGLIILAMNKLINYIRYLKFSLLDISNILPFSNKNPVSKTIW